MMCVMILNLEVLHCLFFSGRASLYARGLLGVVSCGKKRYWCQLGSSFSTLSLHIVTFTLNTEALQYHCMTWHTCMIKHNAKYIYTLHTLGTPSPKVLPYISLHSTHCMHNTSLVPRPIPSFSMS